MEVGATIPDTVETVDVDRAGRTKLLILISGDQAVSKFINGPPVTWVKDPGGGLFI